MKKRSNIINKKSKKKLKKSFKNFIKNMDNATQELFWLGVKALIIVLIVSQFADFETVLKILSAIK